MPSLRVRPCRAPFPASLWRIGTVLAEYLGRTLQISVTSMWKTSTQEPSLWAAVEKSHTSPEQLLL